MSVGDSFTVHRLVPVVAADDERSDALRATG